MEAVDGYIALTEAGVPRDVAYRICEIATMNCAACAACTATIKCDACAEPVCHRCKTTQSVSHESGFALVKRVCPGCR